MRPAPDRRLRTRVAAGFAVLAAIATASCATGRGEALSSAFPSTDGGPTAGTTTTVAGPTPTTPATSTTSTTTSTTSTTTAPPAPFVPPEPGTVAVRTPSGILALWYATAPDGRMLVSTPCDRRAVVAPSPLVRGVDVLLDPGHGGLDPGATAPNGMQEAELNLDVSLRVAAMLRAAGRTVELTRDEDHFRTLADRAQLALAVAPKAFVSVHHNSGIDAAVRGPIGTEIYVQRTSPDARRLGGLVYEEMVRWLSPLDVAWTRSARFGVRWRDNGNGADFYGVLRRSAGVPAVLVEGAYLSSSTEAAVLRTDAFRDAEARAIALGILRWLTTFDQGVGYQDGVVEGGSGGNSDLSTCRDPDLDRPRP